jgi:membrane protease YdiL (CAAX protease family)
VFTNEQLVNPAWEPVSLKGLKRARIGSRAKDRKKLPAVDEALGLFALTLLLSFYIAPSLQRFGLIPMLLVQQALLLAGPAIVFAYVAKWNWRDTFSLRAPAITAIAGAFLLGVGLTPWMQLLSGLQQKVWAPDPTYNLELMKMLLPPMERYPIFIPILIGVAAGLCEETLFRGPIQRGLLRRMPQFTAVVIASILFAAAHLDLYGLPIRTLLGVILGWIVIRTGSIFPAMLMHATYDITQLAFASIEVSRRGAQEVIRLSTDSSHDTVNLWFLLIGTLLVGGGMLLLLRSHRAKPLPVGPAQPALS